MDLNANSKSRNRKQRQEIKTREKRKLGLPGVGIKTGMVRDVRLRRPHPSDAARFFKGDSQHRGYSHLKPLCQVRQRKHTTSARSFQIKSSEERLMNGDFFF